MQRIMVAAAVLCAVVSSAWCQVLPAKDAAIAIEVGSALGHPGYVTSVPVTLATNGAAPTALRFILPCDPALLRFVSIDNGPIIAPAQKEIAYNVLPTGIVVSVYESTAKESQPLGDGTLLTVTFRVGSQVASGTSLPLGVTEPSAADTNAQPLPIGALTGFIVVAAGTGPAPDPYHSADSDHNEIISATEISRVVAFYNAGGYQVKAGTTDGFAPEAGLHQGAPHDADFAPFDWKISATELSRLVTFYNAGAYQADVTTLDGFAPDL